MKTTDLESATSPEEGTTQTESLSASQPGLPNPSIQTQAAGKVLSQLNAGRIKTSVKGLIDLLVDAKVLSVEDLTGIIEEEKKEAASGKEDEAESEEAGVQAGSFKTAVEYMTWSDRLSSTLNLFKYRFASLHNESDDYLQLEEGVTRDSAKSEIIRDLADILSSLSQDHPGVIDADGNYYPMSLSAEEIKDGDAKVIAFEFPVEKVNLEASEISAAASFSNDNRRPIQGVLFRIDEPSEATPAVGPGLPLYIPKHVAEQTLNYVSGLPLDADDSLSKHANKEIAGVIQSAEIKGQDYYVSGYMWPWSQSTKVQAIAQNIHKLGMSMNAAAKGHQAEVDGKKVFWVDQLQLLGANILFSEKATYRQTRLVAAEALQKGGVLTLRDLGLTADPRKNFSIPPLGGKVSGVLDEVIAAQSGDTNQLGHPATAPEADSSSPSNEPLENIEQDDMSETLNKEILTQLAAIQAGQTHSNQDFTTLKEQVLALANQVGKIQEDYVERQAAIQASAAEAKRQQEQDSLTTAIEAAVARAVNPSGAPARKTYSAISASTGQALGNTSAPSNPHHEIDLQLASINGQLKTLEAVGGSNNVEMFRLIDEKRALEMKKLG